MPASRRKHVPIIGDGPVPAGTESVAAALGAASDRFDWHLCPSRRRQAESIVRDEHNDERNDEYAVRRTVVAEQVVQRAQHAGGSVDPAAWLSDNPSLARGLTTSPMIRPRTFGHA